MRLCFVALAAPIVAAGPIAAIDRTVVCKIVVKGPTYLDGPYLFSPSPDGSFLIDIGETEKSRSPHFICITKSGPDVANASWKEEARNTHAQGPLGTAHPSGDCWDKATVQTCAR